MATEKGQNVLIKVGDGGSVEIAGTIYSIAVSTGLMQLHRASGDFTASGLAEQMVIHVAGFAQGDFHALVDNVAATDVDLIEVMDADGNPLQLVDEVAGVAVTITAEAFNTIKGQDDSQMNIAASSIDASTKDTGKWGASLSGTNRMSLTCNGKVNWRDLPGLQKIFDSLELEGEVWCKVILNLRGDFWFGLFAVTQANIGGQKDGATSYQLTLENKLRPNYVAAA